MEEIRRKNRAWINILLFGLTIVSAFFVGINWSLSFKYGDAVNQDFPFSLGERFFKDPQVIFLSVLYSAVLITILLGHELGHYLTCRRYGIDATLPYFIPAPTLIGTLGAFIKIKSPITRKQQLFDIGAAGPLDGLHPGPARPLHRSVPVQDRAGAAQGGGHRLWGAPSFKDDHRPIVQENSSRLGHPSPPGRLRGMGRDPGHGL